MTDPPTERLDTQESPPGAVSGVEPRRERQSQQRGPSRGPVILLGVLVALVIAAGAVLATILVGRSVTPPTAAPTSSATSPAPAAPRPSASAKPVTKAAPPAAVAAGTFTSLTPADRAEGCSHGGPGKGPGPGQGSATLVVSWATADATSVWIAPGTSDAADARYLQVPRSGDQTDFSRPVPVDCTTNKASFTMTLVNANGKHVSKSWTVRTRGGGHGRG